MTTLNAHNLGETLRLALDLPAVRSVLPGGIHPNRIPQEITDYPAAVWVVPQSDEEGSLNSTPWGLTANPTIMVGGLDLATVSAASIAIQNALRLCGRPWKSFPNGRSLCVGKIGSGLDIEEMGDGMDDFFEKLAFGFSVVLT